MRVEIKFTPQQKDVYLILTRKCFTIALKTIQLSSHITQHHEFIKATFSSEIFFETNNIFAIRGKYYFLFHYVREDKKLMRVKLHSVPKTQLNKFPTSVQPQTLKSSCLRDRGRLGNEGRPISLKIGTQSTYVDLCNTPKLQLQRLFFSRVLDIIPQRLIFSAILATFKSLF